MQNIRNFVIIAHIDHGKSTLADRFLELTGTVEKRKMQEQYLDTMELERERGITIKLQPVRMIWRPPNHSEAPNPKSEIRNKSQIQNANSQNSFELSGSEYILNLIDTPGHVDFSYEVSRSLAAVEGAILLVDATKGIQAQTLANLHLAEQQKLKIIPVVNKIDMPNARTAQVKEELSYLLAVEPDEVLEVSGKIGTNVDKLLERVVRDVPPPVSFGGGRSEQPQSGVASEVGRAASGSAAPSEVLKALIFDSTFDAYKGVIAFVRIFGGSVKRGDKILMFAAKAKADVLEVGFFSPQLVQGDALSAGETGYIATGLKDPGLVRVGDTITTYDQQLTTNNFKPLSGYKEVRPMVFASFFPENSDDYDILKDALGKLRLTDAALVYEPESSIGLGRGFRLGFLGMLHVEIISERLRREFGLELIISSPSVEYLVKMNSGEEIKVRSAAALPDVSKVESIAEPIVELEVIAPTSYVGGVMELVSTHRARYIRTDYLGKETALLKYEVPLAEVITEFYDQLKSVSSGYASMSYEPKGFQTGDLVRLDILVADDIVEPFSRIVPRDKATYEGRAAVMKLKEIIPQQWFAVALQAAIGGKILARETISARRKDVTGYLYGGDVTRKMKLLEKQKRGKKKMKEIGKVDIPQDVFLKMLKK